jgi:ankyrin repeat protein
LICLIFLDHNSPTQKHSLTAPTDTPAVAAEGAESMSESMSDFAKYMLLLCADGELSKLCDAVGKFVAASAMITDPAGCGGFSLLSVASGAGHLEVAQYLVANGADVNCKWSDGTTAVFMASQEGHADVVRFLVGNGANINASGGTKNATPLYVASGEGHLDVVQCLLESGADANLAVRGTDDMDGATPLYIASGNGHLDVVRLLTSTDADVNAMTDGSITPLHMAIQGNHLEVVRHLITQGATVDRTHTTALITAVAYSDVSMLRILIENGRDVNETQPDGFTPLSAASQLGRLDKVRFLVEEAGAHVDLIGDDDDPTTAVYMACQNGHADVVRYLVGEAGADITISRMHGTTPKDVAFWCGHYDIVHLLDRHAKHLRACANCGEEEVRRGEFPRCAKEGCRTRYCSRACQKRDWKERHRGACPVENPLAR